MSQFWSEKLFVEGNKPVQKMMPPPPLSKVTQNGSRVVEFEWFDRPLPENEGFIIDSATDLVIDYGCDAVRIRKEIHNTASTMEFTVMQPPTEPRAMRRNVGGVSQGTLKVRTIVPAPWHYTVEFRAMATKMWFTAHVYAETKTVKVKSKIIKGVATGELSLPNGDEIKQNPELFEASPFSLTKGRRLYKTPVIVPILAGLPIKEPPRRCPPADKRLERVRDIRR